MKTADFLYQQALRQHTIYLAQGYFKINEKILDYFINVCYNNFRCEKQQIFALIAQLDRASAF